ncbi:MAG: hypothetical protein JXB38_01055 [Anaerolineales bacterium]|nr:hypothetical protein [Anaerolineales bacterium]
MGHAFNNRLNKAPEKLVEIYDPKLAIDPNFSLLDKTLGFSTEYDSDTTWLQHDERSGTEKFADMFLGWVGNKWADDEYGDARRKFMREHMRGWILEAGSGRGPYLW